MGSLFLTVSGRNYPNSWLLRGKIELTQVFLGITFSPDAKYAYIADTGASQGFWGWNQSEPASM